MQTLPDALYQGLDAPEFGSIRGYIGIGDRPPWWDDAQMGAPFLEDIATTAGSIGRLALAIHAAGGALAPEAALPIYVTGDSPWKPHGGARAAGTAAEDEGAVASARPPV
jgi:hypothetical protein